MLRRRVAGFCAALVLLGAGAPALAGEAGFFGLSLEVQLDGTPARPLLREVSVEKVLPGSPAAQAGIRGGDVVVEVEGRAVAGSNALEFQKRMQREVGQPLRLRLRRGNAEPYQVTLIAVPRRSD